MTTARWALALAACALASSACKDREDVAEVLGSPTAVAREKRLERALNGVDGSRDRGTPLAQWLLPAALQEISGLALTSDQRLLVHDDEVGQVWEVDYRRGALVKHFSLGKEAEHADFEAITVAGDVIYMLTSTGKVYEFKEGKDKDRVGYKVHDTGLKKECEFESMAFDSATTSLLLACKHVRTKALEDDLVIYRWNLKGDSTARLSRFTVPLGEIIGTNAWKGVHPSDITIDPLTGNYVFVASLENALVSITPSGEVVFARPLPSLHHQAEGLAITKDSILIVSDEAGERRALITLYKWP